MKKILFFNLSFLFFSITLLAQTEWHITGNSGTAPGTNFVGTTDNKNLIFKINNSISGIIDNVNANTSLGYKTLSVNTSAANTAVGFEALQNNTGTYQDNSGANTAIGSVSMFTNTTGAFNVAIGTNTLYSNTSGNNNIAVGSYSLNNNTSGPANTAVGISSLSYNVTGSGNCAYGYTSSIFTTGSYNSAFGPYSLYQNTSSSYSCAFGYKAMYANTTGSNNVGLGYEALYSNTTGTNNTALGYNANVNNINYTNTTMLGNSAIGTASNQVRVGNSSVTSIGGYVGWSNISDGRVKKNIKENVPGLAFINALKAVTYNYDFDAADKIISSSKHIKLTQDEIKSRQEKQKIVYTGFIAQEVEKAAKSINYNFSGVEVPKNDKDLYSLRYSEFVVPLVNAVQELSKTNDAKDSAILQMSKKIENLQSQIDELKAMFSNSNSNNKIANNQLAIVSSSSLAQNIPNPFTNTTNIAYSLPQTYSSAQLIVTDKNGRTLKEIILNAKGKSNLQLDASTLAAGAYQYSLLVNGRIIDTKQMVLSK